MNWKATSIILMMVCGLIADPPKTQRGSLAIEVPDYLEGPLDNEKNVIQFLAAADDGTSLAVAWRCESARKFKLNSRTGDYRDEDGNPLSTNTELIKLAVLDRSGGRKILPAPELSGLQLFAGLQNLLFAHSSWHLAFAVPRPAVGVLFTSFGAKGIARSSYAIKGIMPYDLFATPTDSGIRLSWISVYRTKHDLPDFMGGGGVPQVEWSSIATRPSGGARSNYRLPYKRGDMDLDYKVVRLHKGRHDLFWRRTKVTDDDYTRHLMHVMGFDQQNVRGNEIATIHVNSNFVPVALSDDRIYVIGLEDVNGTEGVDGRRASRMVSSHFESDRWSTPMEIARKVGWNCSSLAAAAIHTIDGSAILVICRDGQGRLVYTVLDTDGHWSVPVTTELRIGSDNRLCGQGDCAWLVSSMAHNVYYCCLLPMQQFQATTRATDKHD